MTSPPFQLDQHTNAVLFMPDAKIAAPTTFTVAPAAQFSSRADAQHCADACNQAYALGARDAKRQMRKALGIGE